MLTSGIISLISLLKICNLLAHFNDKPPLDWSIRKRIALGSAKCIAYLQDHYHPKIIHWDVKAASILFDEDEEYERVVVNFGLAIVMDHKDTYVTMPIARTIGHIAPEYFLTEKVSEKTDVYGFGAMLLVLSGQRASDLGVEATEDNLAMLDTV